MGIDHCLTAVEDVGGSPRLADLGADASQASTTLFHVLVQSCKAKAHTVIRLAERSNGFDAWFKLRSEYEPASGGRHAAMLAGLLTPVW
eukprot:2442131-Lingulodinium_polyedra.AAC.1